METLEALSAFVFYHTSIHISHLITYVFTHLDHFITGGLKFATEIPRRKMIGWERLSHIQIFRYPGRLRRATMTVSKRSIENRRLSQAGKQPVC